MKTKNPTITVYMPVYNAGAFLKESLDSILRQTYSNFEFIIINDGSTDGSREIIDTYASRDSRIVVLHQDNQGVVKSANRAIEMSQGKYISRADADDVSFDNKLEDLIRCANDNPDAVVVCGNIEVINEKGEFLYRDLVLPFSEDLKRAFYLRNPIPNGATLIKKEALLAVRGFDDVFAEDCHLWTKLFNLGSFVGTGTIIYKWRTNPSGLTFSNLEKSQQKEKEYAEQIWSIHPPSHLTMREIQERIGLYYKTHPKQGNAYKLILLNDISRIAVHRIKRGQRAAGLHQLLSLALIGPEGIKAVVRRLSWVIIGKFHAARKQYLSPYSNSEN